MGAYTDNVTLPTRQVLRTLQALRLQSDWKLRLGEDEVTIVQTLWDKANFSEGRGTITTSADFWARLEWLVKHPKKDQENE